MCAHTHTHIISVHVVLISWLTVIECDIKEKKNIWMELFCHLNRFRSTPLAQWVHWQQDCVFGRMANESITTDLSWCSPLPFNLTLEGGGGSKHCNIKNISVLSDIFKASMASAYRLNIPPTLPVCTSMCCTACSLMVLRSAKVSLAWTRVVSHATKVKGCMILRCITLQFHLVIVSTLGKCIIAQRAANYRQGLRFLKASLSNCLGHRGENLW